MNPKSESPFSSLYSRTSSVQNGMDCYWYHSDHLGSSSWITYSNGKAVEHLHYMPWGEDFVRQRSTGWHARYTFSAKEKDAETGYSYFGARYYSSDLGIWLSVDPMSDKYPSLSPYVYCGNNPLGFVDPNGREKIPSLNPKTNKKYATARKAIRHYPRNIGVIHLWAHGTQKRISTYNEADKKDVYLNNPTEVEHFLKENSAVYRNNNQEGEQSKTSILVLHSCSTGKRDGIAQRTSKELNLLVVAPTDILTQRSNEDGSNVNEFVKNKGGWSIYYKGEQMGTFSGTTKPLFDNPDKTIERYEKMYQAKYGNQNKAIAEN